ncbi:MAG: alpha/beta fold hydrolase [Acetobacteraceae bacterium]
MELSQTLSRAFYAAYETEQPIKHRLAGTYDLLRYGYVDNAREVIAELRQNRRGGKRVDWLARACEGVELYHRDSSKLTDGSENIVVEGLPQPISIRLPTDVMIFRVPGARRVLISMGGANSAFWMPTAFFEFADTHVVAFRDTRRLFHLAGVKGLGADYAGSVDGLRKLIKGLGVINKVVMAGCSSGGYAALRYALDLDVRGVLAISAPSRINADESELERYPALRKIARTRPEMMEDLLPLYRRHPTPPSVIMAWGSKNPLDTEQALRMKGLPNVTLEPVPGIAAHASWLKLIADQQFEPLLARLLAC